MAAPFSALHGYADEINARARCENHQVRIDVRNLIQFLAGRPHDAPTWGTLFDGSQAIKFRRVIFPRDMGNRGHSVREIRSDKLENQATHGGGANGIPGRNRPKTSKDYNQRCGTTGIYKHHRHVGGIRECISVRGR